MLFSVFFMDAGRFNLHQEAILEVDLGFAVALGGKGGTGKTTIAGLLIRYMLNHGMKPLLAIDADSNSNLNDVLGVPAGANTVGCARRNEDERPCGHDKRRIHGDEGRTGPCRNGRIRSHCNGTARRSGLLLRGKQSFEQSD